MCRTATIVLMILTVINCAAADRQRSRVTVDPRIELMGVLQMLAGTEPRLSHDTDYSAAALKYFSRYKDDKAVKLLKELHRQGFSYDAVPKFFLSLEGPPGFVSRADVPEEVVRRAGGRQKVRDFAAAVSGFAATSRFAEFYELHEADYRSVVEGEGTVALAAAEAVRRYLGADGNGPDIILGLLMHNGGFSVESTSDDRAYVLIGPSPAEKGKTGFGSETRLTWLVVHESSHRVVDTETLRHLDEIERSRELLEPIKDQMASQAYTDWLTVVNEHIVRAITVRVMAGLYGDKRAEALAEAETRNGFIYLNLIAEKLKRCEGASGRCGSIAEQIPDIIPALTVLAGQDREKHSEVFRMLRFPRRA